MKNIWFEDIVDVMLNIADPNTWAAVSEVPGVSSPKINAGVSVYNVEEWWTGIAWWSTNVSWSASDNDTVAWSSWSIYLPDWTALAVSSWNTGNMSWTTYIYYDRETNTVASSTSASASVGENKILLCVASPVSWSGKKAEFQAFWTNDQSTFIYASNIAANTITGNEIAANSIKAAQIDSWAITTSKIAVKAVWTDELDDWAVTADKIYVSELSAITANLWDVHVWVTTSGASDKSGIRIYPDWSDGKIQFYYDRSECWYIRWYYHNTLWDVIQINASNSAFTNNVWVWWTLYCFWKLRIPVWNDLYN